MRRSIISLVFMALASFMPLSVYAQKAFPDVPANHPYSSSIVDLRERKFVAGHPNGTFTPDRTINRAEFITMVMASIETNPQGGNCFTDVQEQWYGRFICSAKARGLVAGNPDGSYRPGDNISLSESSAILTRAYKLKKTQASFGDPWYRPFIENLETARALPSSIDSVGQKISRAQTAEIIWRLNEPTHTKPTKSYVSINSDVPFIESCSELREKFSQLAYRNQYAGFARDLDILELEADEDSSANGASAAKSEFGGGADYTDTNVQVQGVDEADIVKTDGTYLYVATNKSVRIVKAAPADQLQLVSEIKLPIQTEYEDLYGNAFYGQPNDIFIDGDTLVVLYARSFNYEILLGDQLKSESIYKPQTTIFLIDMKDRTSPKISRTLSFDGSIVSSRRIGGRLFLVTSYAPYIYPLLEKLDDTSVVQVLPQYDDSKTGLSGAMTNCSRIRYIPDYSTFSFVSVAQIDLRNHAAEIEKEVIMGSGDTVYSSLENLYVAAKTYTYPQQDYFDVWNPPQSGPATLLYRFDISDGIEYKTSGRVPGHIINQFAMDEAGNNFRIATTIGQFQVHERNEAGNYIYVLNRDNLAEVLGRTPALAKGESIFSVRFIGNRAYMVTFKKVDPLFVIDLSEARNPRVLGELKIPGFSDYLHPYDENHIIGFGKDTVTPAELDTVFGPGAPFRSDFAFEWYQGMKIALFDVSDVTQPKVKHQVIIGDRGTESEVLTNHKALMYDASQNLFALPVALAEIKDKAPGQYTGSAYGNIVFRGAYVYALDLSKGFQLKGRISHYPDSTDFNSSGYYGAQQRDIRRLVRIGETLYSTSNAAVQAHDLNGLVLKTSIGFDVPASSITAGLSGTTPIGQIVSAGAKKLQVASFTLTPDSGFSSVTHVTFTHVGSAPFKDFTNFALFVDGKAHMANATIDLTAKTVSFNLNNLEIKSGSTATVTLFADLADSVSSGTHQFGFERYGAVQAPVEVKNLPLFDNILAVQR